ncbi:MAG: hypothetical protein WC528_01630 [Patescibacteria group bacterium]
MAQRIEILDGPSKFDALIALFVGQNHEQKWVEFKITPKPWKRGMPPMAPQTAVNAAIRGMERADVSGERWIIKAYSVDREGPHDHLIKFDFRTRHGWIQFLS